VHVHLLDEYSGLLELGVRHVFQRHGDTWLSFNVTAAVVRPKSRTQLRLLVHIRATGPDSQFDLALVVNPHQGSQFQDVQPLLLLSYSTLTVISCFFSLFIPAVFFNVLGSFVGFSQYTANFLYIFCVSQGRHVSASLFLGHLQVHRSLCSLQCQV